MRKVVFENFEQLKLNDAKIKVVDTLLLKLNATLRQELSSKKLEPLINQVYKSTFTQDEIYGLITFYKSDLSKTLRTKLPEAEDKARKLWLEQFAPAKEQMLIEIRKSIAEIRNTK